MRAGSARAARGTNREGAYWRYELWLRERESALGSITGGNGAVYAVRRTDYVEVDPRFGHDLSLPYLMARRGRRAVYEPDAHSFEKPSRNLEDEYRRKVRMFEHCWLMLLRGGMLRGVDSLYRLELVSHRVLRYGSGMAHLALLLGSVGLAHRGGVYRAVLAAQLAGLGLAAAGRLRAPVPGAGLALYYVLVTEATVVALLRTLRGSVPRSGRRPRARDEASLRSMKRVLDVTLAALTLTLASPLLALSAVAIKLEDRGPALFRQTRVGLGGREFGILKLRTMVVGAESTGAGLAVNRGDSASPVSAACCGGFRSTSSPSCGTCLPAT